MNSIYFQITSSGYRRSDKLLPQSIDTSKQLPVFRTVNEFMDLPAKQQTVNKNRTEQNSSVLGVNLNENKQSNQQQYGNVKFVALNSVKQYKEDQTNSIKTDDLGSELRRPQKSLTVYQNYQKLTAIPIGSLPYQRQYTSDAKTQKSTLNLQGPQHSKVYYELQKQKALRQNLEKSYRSLLQKVQKNENSSKEEQQTWHFDQFSRKQKRYSTQQPMTERLNKCEFQEFEQSVDGKGLKKQKNKNMRSSCCNFKQVELEDQIKDQDLELEQEHLNLVSQNELMHQSIQEDMQFLKNKLVQVENKMLHIQLHQKEQELYHIQNEVSEDSLSKLKAKHQIPNKQRIHYLFTILVMFLTMALMSKK